MVFVSILIIAHAWLGGNCATIPQIFFEGEKAGVKFYKLVFMEV